MATNRATARTWIEGFEAAREAERRAGRPEDGGRAAVIALQLSDAALAARAPQMKARREAEDQGVRETWCRLKRRLAR